MKQAIRGASGAILTKTHAMADRATSVVRAIASNAHAQTSSGGTIDLTQDTSGGKKFGDVMNNLNQASQQGASTTVAVVAVLGYVVVALSLYQLWKASKEDRESPKSGIIGLFIGGAMAGVGTIMWIMKNTVTG